MISKHREIMQLQKCHLMKLILRRMIWLLYYSYYKVLALYFLCWFLWFCLLLFIQPLVTKGRKAFASPQQLQQFNKWVDFQINLSRIWSKSRLGTLNVKMKSCHVLHQWEQPQLSREKCELVKLFCCFLWTIFTQELDIQRHKWWNAHLNSSATVMDIDL